MLEVNEIKQILYIAAVIVIMIVAARYMKKIKDKPSEKIPEDREEPLPEEEEPEDVEIDETAE